ncbi:SusC/RagA family TonB-linked outer membrane protein [Paraflavitalea sp. CAU 1676]|uniref:SusC/RagA family TonB-linked outer membrane protein n=1 Tax=Paraflavitalea sp. CAU 1676 TaxID=3032598 RepID=UPI0023DCD82F|nr:SusC/RagA family TonB-linked outer membrane protein [Paraflavitalea sp. CAU 1676]MDF2191232.1 SusC/RagA family TonB-linked outer membrane protein [Paraflavitalea sp. CAU 1676]
MKLLVTILTSVCIQVSANSSAQISINLRDAPLDKVFAEIEKQTTMIVLFDYKDLEGTKKVTIKLNNSSYQLVLNKALEGQSLTYEVKNGNSIRVYKISRITPDTIPSPINAPNRVILNGKLENAAKEPVVGATIQEKGRSTITISNERGEFQLPVNEKGVIIITSINYKSREIRLNGTQDLVIQLDIKSLDLEEVKVVSTGYQDIPKERTTGSFVQINNGLLNRRVSTDVLSRLEGIASGMLFDKASAGNPLGITIRGKSTIYGSTQPLIVVDNYPYTGDINSINPNDVESITLLKDAAASSIWGAFSGNGVVVITTKKGGYNKKVSIDANLNYTIVAKPDLFYSKRFLNAGDFIDVEKSLFDAGFYESDLVDPTFPVISPAVEILDQMRSGVITQEAGNAKLMELRKRDVRRDYSDYLYRAASRQQYALSASGGSDKMNYYLSLGYNKDQSEVVGNEGKRVTLSSVTSYKPVQNLEITGRIIYAESSEAKNGLTGVSSGGRYTNNTYPYARLKDEDGNELSITKDYRASFVSENVIPELLDWTYSPLKDRRLFDNDEKNISNRISVNLRYAIVKALSLDLSYQYQRENFQAKSNESAEQYSTRNLINSFATVDGGSVIDFPIPKGGIVSYVNQNTVANSGRIQVSYNNNFSSSAISILGGGDFTETKVSGTKGGVYGYNPQSGASQSVNYNTLYTLYPFGYGSYISDLNQVIPEVINKYRAFFFNGSYIYDRRYTATVSARLDQSNLFGVKTNQKQVPLWSTGLKWDIANEAFLQGSIFQKLALRITYGKNGNLNRSVTALTKARYLNGGINNSVFLDIVSPGNPQLTWETMSSFNIGLDFNVFKHQNLSGTIEFFKREGNNLIGDRFIPSSTGFLLARGNFSSMKGSGLDITLQGRFNFGPIRYESIVMTSYATDRVTRNEGNTGLVVGNPVSSLYSYQWAKLDESGDPVGYLDGKESKDYAQIILNTSADPTLWQYSGSTAPRYFGSFRNTFQWKNVSISANIIFKAGYVFRRSSVNYGSLYNQGVGNEDFLRRWQKTGDEVITQVPAMVYIDYPQFSERNTFYDFSGILVEKGDHIRLQDVSLTYDLPSGVSKKAGLSNVQFYIYCNNLGLLWTANKENIDPDFTDGYKTPRSASIGARLTF